MVHALSDLEASIKLMPLSLFDTLGLENPKSTRVVLQLVDRSMAYLEGIIEDVLINFGKFVIPTDFIILDFKAYE